MRRDKEKTRLYNKQYRIENAGRINEMKKRWNKENPEKVKARNIRWKKNNPEKLKESSYKNYRKNGKNQYLLKEYGITQEQYNKLFIEQKGLCAICNNVETKRHNSGSICQLAVDHDHKTGKIRGLLCNRCNLMLGNSGDDIDLLLKAVKYLTSK